MAIQRWSSWATNYFNGDSTKDIWSAQISKWQYRDNLVGRLNTSVKDRWTPRFRDDLVGRLTTSTGDSARDIWFICISLSHLLPVRASMYCHIMISTEIQMTIHICSSSTTSTRDIWFICLSLSHLSNKQLVAQLEHPCIVILWLAQKYKWQYTDALVQLLQRVTQRTI